MKKNDNNLETNNKLNNLKSFFKLEKKEASKIKLFDMLLIFAIVLTVGIFSFFVINKVFSKDYTGNIAYYKLTFDSDGGSKFSSVKVKEGYVELPTNVEKDGYNFKGWAVDDKIVDSNYYVKKSTSFKAIWELDGEASHEISGATTYTVHFDFNDGSNTHNELVVAGSVVNKPVLPTREGYIFNGWYCNEYEYDFNTPISGDITLVAQWTQIDGDTTTNSNTNTNTNNNTTVYHTVTFDLNGGGNNYTKQVASGKKVAKPSTPTRTGYTFNGWTYNGSTYDFNSAVKKDITLVAQWNIIEVIKYDVTFEPCNGEAATYQTVNAQGKVSKPINPVKIGYTFLGWYRQDKTLYNFSSGVNSNMTLYALWKPNTNLNNKIYNSKKHFIITDPTDINSTDYLADSNYGNNLLFKSSFSGNAEIHYAHNMSGSLSNNTYYGIRFYNESDEEITITINKCGAVVGNDFSSIWKQYYNGTCNVAGKKYIVSAHRGLLILHNDDSFVVRSQGDQSGVAKISGSFEGVLNINSTGEILIAFLTFKDIDKTYTAVYNP